jgi:chromate reductase
VFDKKPAAVVTASIGAIGGFGANHQIRQSCVFLNMPVMTQPEAYLGNVGDDAFDENGNLKDGGLKDVVTKVAHAFHDWVDMIHRSRAALAEDAAHAAKDKQPA